MSNRDPIEDWLGADVELLPPRPGSFDRIHRRARHRKTVVALTSAAAAAVVIAAAAALPQLASGIFPGHGGPAQVRQSSHSPSPRKSSPGHRTSTPQARHGRASLSPPGRTSSITNSSYPPYARFEPTSVTFIGQSIGAVIGQTTTKCPAGSCTVVASTGNYGQSWAEVDAPPAGQPDGATGVDQIRFLTQQNGWAYGPELYATHDGGATWTRITGLPGRVIDLATVGSSAFAVVGSCDGAGYADGCTSFALYSSPASSNDWQQVSGAAGQQPETPGGLQFTSDYGYVLAGPVIYSGSPSGGAWAAVTIKSGTVPACLSGARHQAVSGETGLIAPGQASTVYLTCQASSGSRPVLYRSADGGQTWQRAGSAVVAGTATSLAVVPAGGQAGGDLILATSSGLYYSAGGTGWQQAALSGGAPARGFAFVGMTTSGEGVAVPANPGAGELYITTDGGLSWHPVSISPAT